VGHIVALEWLKLPCENDLVTFVTKFNLSYSHADWYKFRIHLRCLNVLHFRMVQATGLEILDSRSTSVAWPLYWISWKPTSWYSSYYWRTHRWTDRQHRDLISLTYYSNLKKWKWAHFKESRLITYVRARSSLTSTFLAVCYNMASCVSDIILYAPGILAPIIRVQ
jgi:hypothetical protein